MNQVSKMNHLCGARLTIAAAVCAFVIGSLNLQAESEKRKASPDEILAGNFLMRRGFSSSSDGRLLSLRFRKGSVLLDLGTGHLSDSKDGFPSKKSWSPTAPLVALLPFVEGKTVLTVWNPESGDKRELLVFPRRMNIGEPLWSPDGKTIYITAALNLPREKSLPADDNPPTRSLNANIEATAPYKNTPDYKRYDYRRFAEAYAEGSRVLILAVNAESGQAKLVCTGNDTYTIEPSPDGKTVGMLQFKENMKGKETVWTGQVLADVYLAQVEQAVPITANDLENYEDRTAGWVDSAGHRLLPVLTNLMLNDLDVWDPMSDKGNDANPLLVWASDSTHFAFATVGRKARGDVFTYDISSKALTNITEHVALLPQTKDIGYGRNYTFQWDSPKFGHIYPPLWLPDNHGLVAIGHGDVWYLPCNPSEPARNLTKDIPLESCRILPRFTRDRAYVDASDNLVVLCKDPGSRMDSIWKVNVRDGKVTKIADLSAWVTMLRACDYPTTRLIYMAHTNEVTDNVYELDLNGGTSPKLLTQSKTELADREYPECRILSWKTSWGAAARGLLFLPKAASPEHKVPMILDGYPGLWESRIDTRARRGPPSLDQTLLTYLNEGIAVFRPDLPMSDDGVYEHPMKQVVDGVNAATDAALMTGVIDDARLGILGESYGGFMVQATITQTDRFKVAVSIDGLSDWYADYLDQSDQLANYHEVAQGRFGQPLWEDPSRYVDDSPFSYWGKIHTPLLLIHGEQDHTVPIARSIQGFHGLERLDRTAVFARSFRDGHLPGPEQLLRINAWFREYLLGGKPSAHLAVIPSFFFDGPEADANAAGATTPAVQANPTK